MNEKRIRATVAISGLTLMVLALAEMITWNNPQLSDPASRVRDIFVADSTTSSVSIFLTALTVIPILAFAASLRVLAQRTSGIDSVWALLASGAASVFAAAQITFAALSGALVAGAPDATDHEIRLLLGPLTFLDAARFMPFAVMTAAAALATREAGVVPPWVVWVGVASGALNFVSELSLLDWNGPLGNIGNAGQLGFLLFIVWTLVMAWSLLRRNSRQASSRRLTRDAVARS
jgi:hypothetical protein